MRALLRIAFATVLLASPAFADEGGNPEDEYRLVFGLGGGAAVPATLGETGDAGGLLTANVSLRASQYMQWDIADFSASFFGEQAPGVDLDSQIFFAGTGFRFGLFGDRFVQPYASAGIGGVAVRIRGNQLGEAVSVSDWGLGGTVGAGVNLAIFDRVATGVRYRWIARRLQGDVTQARLDVHTFAVELELQ